MNNFILEFMEKWTTLHHSVEITYIVSGYELWILRDGDDYIGPFVDKSIVGCFQLAASALI